MMSSAATQYLVDQSDLRQGRFVEAPLPELEAGEARLSVDRFAFTANNITYAELGERLQYWKFFPTNEAGWGTIPVWGFADVVDSRCDELSEGERIYGFLPMATHLVVRPERVAEASFVDGMPHRQALPPAYNLYMRCQGDPLYDSEREDLLALLRPLFITSFLIDDFLEEASFFGAERVLLSSASSKVAFGLAHLLDWRSRVEVIGLTSDANRGFVESLGCYRHTLGYGDITDLPVKPRAVYVDFAGSSKVRMMVHTYLRNALAYSCAVGMSHRDLEPSGAELPGPPSIFFFAPDRLRKRARDWGRGGIDARFGVAWRNFVPRAADWLKIKRGNRAAIPDVHAAILAGRVAPDHAQMLSLRE